MAKAEVLLNERVDGEHPLPCDLVLRKFRKCCNNCREFLEKLRSPVPDCPLPKKYRNEYRRCPTVVNIRST